MHHSAVTSGDVEDEKHSLPLVDEMGKNSIESSIDEDAEFSKQEQKKIIRKVDFRLIGSLGLMSCVALMDRTNLGSASIAGMTSDLGLNIGYRYSLIVLVFFITYILCQPPMTILCRMIGPRTFLAGITLTWGVLMIGFAFSRKWSTMIPLRLVLGFCEGGFLPGSIYLISTWYTRYEVHKRYTVFYTIGIVASACSGILAFGLMQMDGIGGLAGWRWIFLVEGLLTCLIGCVTFFTLIDFPDQVLKKPKGFLNESEIQFIIRRVGKDRDDVSPEPFDFKKWISAGADPKLYGFALIVLCGSTVSYSIAYFLPIILLKDMGFSVAKAQCLVAPPYGFAAIIMYCCAWVGDRFHTRGPVLIFCAVIDMIGLPLMAFTSSSAVRYFGVFLVTAGSCAILPTSWSYQANNVRGQWKRAFGSATMVGLGGIGGIAGGLVFRSQDAPKYLPGIYATLACNALIVVVVIILSVWFKVENRRADMYGKVLEGSPDFRFTI